MRTTGTKFVGSSLVKIIWITLTRRGAATNRNARGGARTREPQQLTKAPPHHGCGENFKSGYRAAEPVVAGGTVACAGVVVVATGGNRTFAVVLVLSVREIIAMMPRITISAASAPATMVV